MARRRTHHRRHHHRRRHHMGAINAKGLLMRAASVAAGAFVGRTLQNMVAKSMPSVSPKYVALGTVAVGVLVPKFIKSSFGEGLGDGVMAIGVLSSLQQFGVITGIGAMPGRVNPRVIRGYNPGSKAVGSYNAGARAVGVTHPHMNRTVGSVMPGAKEELMMGALLYDE